MFLAAVDRHVSNPPMNGTYISTPPQAIFLDRGPVDPALRGGFHCKVRADSYKSGERDSPDYKSLRRVSVYGGMYGVAFG